MSVIKGVRGSAGGGALRRLSSVPGLGIGLGLAAAGLTAAAGFAADRLSTERRVALALDEELEKDLLVAQPDEERVVTTDDGVDLHVEVDSPRGGGESPDGSARAGEDPVGRWETRPTVVLSHGYCLSLRCWVFQRRALAAAGYRVVAWDQRGHGRSGSAALDSYHVDRLGRDLERVIEEVVPEGPLVLVGHSMGGMTMMSLALERPDLLRERVVGAAFVATSPGNMGEVSYGLGAVVGGLVHRLGPGATGLLARRQDLVDGLLKAGRDVVDVVVDAGSFASPVPMSVTRLTSEMIFGTRMEVISAFWPGFDSHDKRTALDRFDGIETLVLSGMQDRVTPPEHSEEIVRAVPGAEHVLVSDAGHVIMLEHPELITDHLLGLVRRAERASGPEPAGRPQPVPRTVTDVSSRRRAVLARRARSRRRP